MTSFLDGPAKGQTFMLTRAPHYLRIVQDAAGKWDALDQLDDTPTADETIVVYEMVGEPSSVHVCARGRNNRSGWYRGGQYRLVDPQPDDAAVRTTPAWRVWVSAKVGRPVAADGTAEARG